MMASNWISLSWRVLKTVHNCFDFVLMENMQFRSTSIFTNSMLLKMRSLARNLHDEDAWKDYALFLRYYEDTFA